MNEVSLIFPHQLFSESPALDAGRPVYLIEEFLFFTHYAFHKQKLLFHRASMKAYADYLAQDGYDVNYIDATHQNHDIRVLVPYLRENGVELLHFIDPTDDWLTKRLKSSTQKTGLTTHIY